jgi:hypothetical protein
VEKNFAAVSIDKGASCGGGSFLGWLVERGSLTAEMAQSVARVQTETSGRLVAIVLAFRLLSESRMADALADYCRLPRLVPDTLPSEAPSLPGINRSFLLAYEILPVRASEGTVELACWDPLDDYPAAAVKFALGRGVCRCVGTRTEIMRALGILASRSIVEKGIAMTRMSRLQSA